MLYEFAIQPDVFRVSDSTAVRLEELLKQIYRAGLLSALGDVQRIFELLRGLPPCAGLDRAKNLLMQLEKERRIGARVVEGCPPCAEGDEWLTHALRAHRTSPFDAIVLREVPERRPGKQPLPNEVCNCEQATASDRPWMDNLSHRLRKDPGEYGKLLGRPLAYSHLVHLVDPYFSGRQKYMKTLSVVAEGLRRSGEAREKSIQVHFCEGKGGDGIARAARDAARSYGMTVEAWAWPEQGGSTQHDRFILTDVCAVHSGHSLDCSPGSRELSTWSLLGRSDALRIRNDYNPSLSTAKPPPRQVI